MTYTKQMFTVERPNLQSTIQKPKRLPTGSSPTGRFAAMLQDSTKALSDPLKEQVQKIYDKPNVNIPAKDIFENMKARRNPDVEKIVAEGKTQRMNSEALSTFAKVMQESPTPLKTLDQLLANPSLAAQMGIDGADSAKLKDTPFMTSFHKMFRDMKTEQSETSVRSAQHRRAPSKFSTLKNALNDMLRDAGSFTAQANSFADQVRESSQNGLGSLAAKFESGKDGISAIGYDSGGGTSYGKYQIASKVGSMAAFIDFAETAAPDIAAKLKAAGPSNTGGRAGKMPTVWKQIAAAEPERFENLQEQFIQASHYMPALGAISKATGLEPSEMPAAMHEVIFSTAVQHGPNGASKIFSRAFNQAAESFEQKTAGVNVATSKELGEALIKSVYNIRSKQFSAHNSSVRGAVQNRLRTEMNIALNMLRENSA